MRRSLESAYPLCLRLRELYSSPLNARETNATNRLHLVPRSGRYGAAGRSPERLRGGGGKRTAERGAAGTLVRAGWAIGGKAAGRDAGDGNWEAENVETIGESPWRRVRRSPSKGSGVSGVQPPLEPVPAARCPCRWPAGPVCRGTSIIPTLCPRFQLNPVVGVGTKSPENQCFAPSH